MVSSKAAVSKVGAAVSKAGGAVTSTGGTVSETAGAVTSTGGTVVVDGLLVVRGGNEVLPGVSCSVQHGTVTERLRQAHADAGDRRRTADRRRLGPGARNAGRVGAAARPGRLPLPGVGGLRRPHGRREPALLRRRPARPGVRRRPGAGRRRPGPAGEPTGRIALWRSAGPGVAGQRAARRPGGAGARRAHRRPGPGAAPGPVGAVPPVGRRRHHDLRFQPRDGRGHPMQPAVPDAHRAVPGRGHPSRPAPADRRGRHRDGLPAADRRRARARGSFGMNPRITLATAGRVLRQLRHDPRTIGLLLVVPVVLVTLLRLVYDGKPQIFDRIGAALLGVFPLITMFLVTSIATLRERTSGTLERLLTMPLAKLDLLLGYALAFGAFAVLQVAVANAVLGTALGLFVSAFAASEFQAVQFMPAVILPQLLLCGLLLPRGQMQTVLRWVSNALPLSYAIDGLTRVTSTPGVPGAVLADLGIVLGCIVAALGLGAATLRRRTA